MANVLVRGAGDVGSAVAHRLHAAGHNVVLHDLPRPAHPRRGMAFVDALFDGSSCLADMLAKRARDRADLEHMCRCRQALPVSDLAFEAVLAALQAEVLVDARMRKRAMPEDQRALVPLTIGLGPNFEAGRNVHVAVETAWGEALGQVIRAGRSRELAGEPRAILGRARDRFVYAPLAGEFSTALQIGDPVDEGMVVGAIDGQPVRAPASGRLRGLTHAGARVERGAKIVEVDPRGEHAQVFGLGERPLAIAAGVLEVVGAAVSPAGPGRR